jgi:hypothetical protein
MKNAAQFFRSPLNPLPRCHFVRQIRFCGLIETAEAKLFLDIVLCWKLPFWWKIMMLTFLRSQWNCQIHFRSLNKTAESAPWSHWNSLIRFHTVSIRQRKPTISNEYIEFLGKFEAICKTTLAVTQGPRMDWLMKKPWVENLWRCPFKLTA